MCAPTTPSEEPQTGPKADLLQSASSAVQGLDNDKWECLRLTVIKVVLWPVSILLGLCDALSYIVYEEPSDYRAAPPEREDGVNGDHGCSSSAPLSYRPKHVDRSRLILRRFVEASRISWTFLVQVLAYFGALHLLSFFGIHNLLHSFRGDAERLIAFLTGSAYELKDGQKVPFSILGSLSTDLSLPYSPAESFPFNSTAQTSAGTRGSRRQHRPAPRTAVLVSILQDDITTTVPDFVIAENNAAVPPVRVQQSAVHTAAREVYSAGAQSAKKASARWMKLLPAKRKLGRSSLEAAQSVRSRAAEVDCGGNAHFLAMCSKLIYEDERIVRDVIERRWGMCYHPGQALHGRKNRSCWLPDIVWCGCSNETALVIMLKGADPLYQLDLRADPPCIKRYRPGMGEVHDGLWAGLHQPDPARPGSTVADGLVHLLTSAGRGKRIFLCGHSMGGALASFLALLLTQRAPGLESSIGGIFTYGAPRCGDAESARVIAELYPGIAFRYAHASDLVCMLPPAWGYEPHGLERYITSFPIATDSGQCTRILRLEADPRTVRVCKAREDTWAHVISLAKIGAGLRDPSESAMRLAMRVLLLAFPGFNDHLPCDYETALREALTDPHEG